MTGASGAIGGAIARRLQAAGYTLHLTSRKKSRLNDLLRQLRRLSSSRVYTYELNLSNLKQGQGVVRDFFKKAKHPYGLICNAGDLGVLGAFLKIDFGAWSGAFEQNFLSQAAMIHAFGQGYTTRRLKNGAIVLLSGAGVGSAIQHTHLSSYGTAKAALTYLAEALAPELASSGLTINAIAPGQVKSGITLQAVRAGAKQAGRYAVFAKACLRNGGVSPDLAAQLVELLLGPAGRKISGRLLSARFDQTSLRKKRGQIIQHPDWFRLRRIDNEMFRPGKP